MNLEELMDNPYAWLILSVCTVFSVIYAIYAGVKGKEKKEISYIVNTHEIVQAGKNMICVIATMMYFRLLKKLFHLNVPSSLRDSIEYNS